MQPFVCSIGFEVKLQKTQKQERFLSPKTKCSLLLLTLPNLCSFWYTHTHTHIYYKLLQYNVYIYILSSLYIYMHTFYNHLTYFARRINCQLRKNLPKKKRTFYAKILKASDRVLPYTEKVPWLNSGKPSVGTNITFILSATATGVV